MSIEHRSRTISFRLTTEEYERFRDLCSTNGISNVSEMARAAINMLLEKRKESPKSVLETLVTDLEGHLQALFVEVKKLNRAFPQRDGSTTPQLSVSAVDCDNSTRLSISNE
jgi:Arc/MetJ-type ribon-helix-helix transcriptional regulator